MQFDRDKSEIGLLYGLISKVRAMLLLKEMVREGWVKPEADYGSFQAQLKRVPADATHLVISIGGNDALGYVDLLSKRVDNSGAALALFAAPLDRFTLDYEEALSAAIALRKPVIVCTIYNGNLERSVATAARIALALFNDVIQRAANHHGVPVIELRSICVEAGDYANPIEPSGPGGLKIARAIASAISSRDGAARTADAVSDPAGRVP